MHANFVITTLKNFITVLRFQIFSKNITAIVFAIFVEFREIFSEKMQELSFQILGARQEDRNNQESTNKQQTDPTTDDIQTPPPVNTDAASPAPAESEGGGDKTVPDGWVGSLKGVLRRESSASDLLEKGIFNFSYKFFKTSFITSFIELYFCLE
jgi:hypothetical protein